MSRTQTHENEIALPVASLGAVRRALEEELGDDEAARVLQLAGHSAGDAYFELLTTALRERAQVAAAGDVAEMPSSAFWNALNDLLSSRGWGRLAHQQLHPGVGALETTDWAEADSVQDALRPSCHFTAGLLANLLGHAAEIDVAVLETECRAQGDSRCRFLFGGPDALDAVYGELVAGRSVDALLASLH